MRRVLFSRQVGQYVLALLVVFGLASLSSGWAQTLSNAPSAQKAKTQSAKNSDPGWPRTFTSGADKFLIYQPQVDSWDGDRINLYSAVEVTAGEKGPSNYGVIWFSARTEVDKVNRLVTLDQVQLTKIKFPGGP